MPSWLADFLRDWGPLAGIATFALGLLGALIRTVWSSFANGVIVSKTRHLEQITFYETQLRLCQEGADRRIEELRQDIEDLAAERTEWRNRFWRSVELGQTIATRDTPPHGIHRSEVGQ